MRRMTEVEHVVETEQPGLGIHCGPCAPDWLPSETFSRSSGLWPYRWEPSGWSRSASGEPELYWPDCCSISSQTVKHSSGRYVSVSLELLARVAYREIARRIDASDRHDSWTPDRIMSLAEDIVGEAAVRWLCILRKYRQCPADKRRSWRMKQSKSPFHSVRYLTMQWFRSQTTQTDIHQAEVMKANPESVRNSKLDFDRRLQIAVSNGLSPRATLLALALQSGTASQYLRSINGGDQRAIKRELSSAVDAID